MTPELVLRLYPRRWRERYEDEMRAVLEFRRSDLLSILDLMFGAVDAHLHYRTDGAPPDWTRHVALAAIGGGAALGVGLILPLPADWVGARLVAFYGLGLVAIAGLLFDQAPRRPVLAWLGAAPAIAAFLVGLMLALLGAVLAQVGIVDVSRMFFIGQLALWPSAAWLGATTLLIGRRSRFGAAALLVGSPAAMLGLFGPGPGSPSAVLAQVGLGVHAVGWILIGWSFWTTRSTHRVAVDP